jgi:hypothetical protein
MIQQIFDETIILIRGREDAFSFLDRLLEIYISSVVLFSFFRTPSAGNTREMVDMIAALFSEKAPAKVPFYSHLFLNGELLSRERE